ncbi:hypothetical protein BC938DRAFT_477939 [Jimgerdemannia flammicorona]|uniref:Uncharacterized protein n=1 Tax=Jimgerdemannia flammicorona TaxID=994334 RepID=A0A433P767_9FUNG|nr:hypothetical protein BC938DRAFT_477939 [Jimgerdemannia flammicorona]
MELKVVNKGDVLETRAQEALNQIFEKQYCVGIPGEVKTILLFGIAFEGKKAFVVTDAINRD